LYDEIVISLLEHHETDISEIINIQLQHLHRAPRLSWQQFELDPMLHMRPDQYAAFSILSSSFEQLQNPNSHHLFFITGSAGVGKSFLLSAVEYNLKMCKLLYLKVAPTGIVAINIEGETIHSALSITT
jgi:DNA replication protein DnaC